MRPAAVEATKPEDWDEEEDGDWEPPKIANPKCKDAPGCGEWKRPNKPVSGGCLGAVTAVARRAFAQAGHARVTCACKWLAGIPTCAASTSKLAPFLTALLPNTSPLPTEPGLQGQVVCPHDRQPRLQGCVEAARHP